MHDRVGAALLSPTGDRDGAPAAPPATGSPGGEGIARFERRAMGSPLRLAVVGVPSARAAAGWDVVSATVEAVEEELSRFRPTAGLVALNARAGEDEPAPVGRWLARALAAADRAGRVTGGAFDPRVLTDLERLGYRGAAAAAVPPGPAARHAERGPSAAFADGRWLRLEPRTGSAAVAAPVDLGGIGKGLALRWAFRALGTALPELRGGPTTGAGALLEAGGDLVAAGAAPQPGPWLVGIDSPVAGDEVAVVTVPDGAICTSSTAVHAWRTPDGRRVHHLLDPRTGEPGGGGLASVTVAGPDPAWAEVWSKTLFLEGAAGIAPRARSLGLAAWWIHDDGRLEMTAAARARTAWVAGEG